MSLPVGQLTRGIFLTPRNWQALCIVKFREYFGLFVVILIDMECLGLLGMY